MCASAAQPAANGGGALAGLRVIELGALLAGPFTGRLLGDLGAEILKVEAPGKPDPIREWGKARYEGRSLWWPVQSRNKKCITLDLGAERGQELLLRLVEQLSTKETAAVLDIAEGTVGSRQFRALKRLKGLLEDLS